MDVDRPYLKGKIHASAALGYACILPFLIEYIPEELIIPVSIYLTCLMGHFLTSALLHNFQWKENLPHFRRLDHTVIFCKIVSTYWVYISTVMINPNIYMMTCMLGGAILGILSRILYTDAPKIIIGIPYIMVGWSILLDLDCLNKLIYSSPELFMWSISGGLMYTIGAFMYLFRYPNPIPKILEYHEMFHIFSTIATMCLTYAIFAYAIPHYENRLL